MAMEGTVLFERCPLCGGGPVVEAHKRGLFRRTASPASCRDCEATFFIISDGVELVRCEPDRVSQIRGLSDAACRHCHPCLQGAAFSREEWGNLAEIEWPLSELSAISQQPSAFSQQDSGLLSEVKLEEGEEIQLEAGPVYVGDEMLGFDTQAGRVVITNRRILFADGDNVHTIPMESIVAVEESRPGLLIQREAGFEPVYLYAPLLSNALWQIMHAVVALTGRRPPLDFDRSG